jgi:hypothetical protein
VGFVDVKCDARCKCGTLVDPFGDDFMVCKKIGNTFKRYRTACEMVGMATSEEVPTNGSADFGIYELGEKERHTLMLALYILVPRLTSRNQNI